MSDCQYQDRLARYHDGELDAADSQQMDRHVRDCPDCARSLKTLRELSVQLAEYVPSPLSQIELARIHQTLEQSTARDDGRLMRFGMMLATMAASVLIISLTWIAQSPATASPSSASIAAKPLPRWERMAMGEPPAAYVPENNAAGIPDTGVAMQKDTAQWMLDGIH